MHEHCLRAEGAVQVVGAERACVEWPADELPELAEFLVGGSFRRIVMRCCVMHVGCEPDGAADVVPVDRGEHLRDVGLTPQRRTGVAVSDAFLRVLPIRHDEPEGQVVRDDLPRRGGAGQLVDQPSTLRRAEDLP